MPESKQESNERKYTTAYNAGKVNSRNKRGLGLRRSQISVCGKHRIRPDAQRLPMQLGGTPAPVCYGGKDNMKDRKLSIRISETDLQTLHHKAARANLSLTEYITKCSLGKQIFVIDGLDEVIRQQKAIGRNLNQLTTLCNMGKVDLVNLQPLTDEYAKLNQTLTELLDRKRWAA